MTLQRFLNAVGDSRLTWLGRSRWRRRPDQSFTITNVVVQAVFLGLAGAVPGLVITLVLQLSPRTAGATWPLGLLASLGALVGLVAFAMVAVAWNRRVKRWVAEGRSEPAELPRLRFWQRWLVGPFYALLFFVVTPLFLWVSVDNALGKLAWERTRASLVARGEPLTMEQLQGPAPRDEDNFAMSPLMRASWDYQVGQTNGRSEPVWRDPVGHARAQFLGVPQSFRPAGEGKGKGRGLNDGRLNLDWVARSIRTEARGNAEGLPAEFATRYGVLEAKPKGLSEAEILALPVRDAPQEVLDFLRRIEPELAEISAAARRPRSRFGTHWEEGIGVYLPYLAHLKQLSITYWIRCSARLAKGDVEGGFADTITGFRIADSLGEDPLILTWLVQVAQFSIATRTAWIGLVDHRWTEPQLVELQGLFERADFRASLVRAFQGERIFSNSIYDIWLGPGQGPGRSGFSDSGADGTLQVGAQPVPPGLGFPGLAPRGMFRRNQINQHRMFDAILAQIRDPSWPRNVGLNESDQDHGPRYLARLGLLPVTPANTLPAMLAPAFRKSQAKAARQFATARMGVTACALERFRLRNKTYPETLEALVPTFLESAPLDPLSGQPLHYQRTDDGLFLLWSVGLNGRDDGGVVKDNDVNGDWVWPRPIPTKDLRLF